MLLPLPLLLLLLSGCQSEAAAMQAFCSFPEHCPECAAASPAERQAALEAYIEDAVRNRAARALIAAVHSAEAGTSSETSSRRAREPGLSSCPMTDAIAVQLPQPIQLPRSQSSP